MWGENAELGLGGGWVGRVAGNKVWYEENAADLAFASDVGRECRISVGQRCGERMQN